MTGKMTHDELLEHLMQAWRDLDEANKSVANQQGLLDKHHMKLGTVLASNPPMCPICLQALSAPSEPETKVRTFEPGTLTEAEFRTLAHPSEQ